MEGILYRRGKRFLFREHYDPPFYYIAWDVDILTYRPPRERWVKLPKGEVELFDLDNPPATVKFISILAPFF